MDKNIFVKEIYINDKPLILTNAAEKFISKNVHSAGYLLLSGAFPRNFRLAKKHLESLTGTGAIIHDLSSAAFEEILKEEYTEVRAAGGLVVNEDGALLMIFRRGHWDLPKGKIDAGESVLDCAVREVKEETGLSDVQAKSKLKTTYHLYEEHNKAILKTTDWFSMESENEILIPQLEEDILIARWVSKPEASLLLKQSYSIIRELVLEHYLKDKKS